MRLITEKAGALRRPCDIRAAIGRLGLLTHVPGHWPPRGPLAASAPPLAPRSRGSLGLHLARRTRRQVLPESEGTQRARSPLEITARALTDGRAAGARPCAAGARDLHRAPPRATTNDATCEAGSLSGLKYAPGTPRVHTAALPHRRSLLHGPDDRWARCGTV